MEDYLKSYCSFLFIPNQTSNRTTLLIGLDDEGPIRIGNDTVFADCVGLVSVVVRKKTRERSWISSRISGISSGIIRCIIQPHFPPLCPRNRHTTLPDCSHYATDERILKFLYMRFWFVNILRRTFGGGCAIGCCSRRRCCSFVLIGDRFRG